MKMNKMTKIKFQEILSNHGECLDSQNKHAMGEGDCTTCNLMDEFCDCYPVGPYPDQTFLHDRYVFVKRLSAVAELRKILKCR